MAGLEDANAVLMRPPGHVAINAGHFLAHMDFIYNRFLVARAAGTVDISLFQAIVMGCVTVSTVDAHSAVRTYKPFIVSWGVLTAVATPAHVGIVGDLHWAWRMLRFNELVVAVAAHNTLKYIVFGS
jgi:hypothetical protein